MYRLPLVAAATCVLALPVFTRELPTAKPESVGMSTERLARIDPMIERYITNGQIVSAVTVVLRDGKVVQNKAYGYQDPDARAPLRSDALFRLASQSKPITAVAILSLVDEGLVRLSDPVSRFIPEFRGSRVAVPKPGMQAPAPLPPGVAPTGPRPDADFVPAVREITVRDLLTHTSGLGSGGLGTMVSTDIQRQPTDTLADFIPKQAKASLDFQPGTRWSYSVSAGFETLSRIVEIVSGKPYNVFLKERLFAPLDMMDTDFVIPAAKQARAHSMYRRTTDGRWETTSPPPAFASDVYFSGAVGLISTARDLARFEQMLLNGGELDGVRILAPRTVELMRTNHVADLFHGMRGNEDGMGFGLGVAVTLDETKAVWRRSVGSAGWYGAFGTIVWHDPREGIVAVLMTQQSVPALQNDFGNAVMQAITSSRPAR
ncbi:MAG TPA: serine hydrolase domain-containing protein [Steroidobacteraceae bacterium]|nr:serine hydrolase domain-containing protein [Steroidobacteraceae bacterium]